MVRFVYMRSGPQPAQALLAVPNVTAHPSTVSAPMTILRYNGPLLCGFNVPIKGRLILRENESCNRRLLPEEFISWNVRLHVVIVGKCSVCISFVLRHEHALRIDKWRAKRRNDVTKLPRTQPLLSPYGVTIIRNLFIS